MSGITSRSHRSRTCAILNETLEPRRLFANIIWDGGGNGTLWSDANNWSPNQVPTAADYVTIDVTGNTTRVEIHGQTSAAVLNIDCSEALDIRGSLSVQSASVIRGPLRLFGSVAGPGNFQVHGYTEVHNNASLVGPGLFTLGPTGRVVIGPTPITQFNVGREMRINNGQVDWMSGQIRLNDARIQNDGAFRTGTAAAELSMVGVAGHCEVANVASGLFQVRAGTMTLSGVALQNDDDLDVFPGARLVQSGGGYHNLGRFNLQAATSSLSLAGNHFFEPTASIAGAGPVELDGPERIDVRGTLNVGTLVVTGSDVESSGPLTVGRLEVHNAAKFTRVGAATIPAALIGGELTGRDGDITFTSDVDWRGGRLHAEQGSRFVVSAGRRLIASNDATRTLSGTLVINGQLQLDRGEIALDGGTIENNNQILINPSGVARIYENENGGLIRNSNAAITKNGTGAASIDADVVHSLLSYVAVNAGSLHLGGEQTNLRLAQSVPGTTLTLADDVTFTGPASLDGVRGHLRIDGGTSSYAGGLTLPQSLTFAGGEFTVRGNVRGVVHVVDGTATLNGGINIIDGGSMTGGTLGGVGAVAIRGTFNWAAGTMAGTGSLLVEDGGTLNIEQGLHVLNRSLDNEGFTHWSGGGIVMADGAIIANDNVFAARSDDELRFIQGGPGASEFINHGNFLKQLGGALVVPPPTGLHGITFANRGQVVASGGRVEVRGPASHTGDFHVDAGSEIILSGSQRLNDTTALTGQGTVRFHGAQAYVDGSQGFASGRLIVEGDSAVGFRGARTWVGTLELGDESEAALPVGGEHLLLTHALSIAPTAKLEINDNPVIIDYTGASPINTIRNALASGYANGTWTGGGICSKYASLTPGMGVGYAEASDLFTTFPATFAGQAIDSTAVVMRATLYGDANLDGSVNLSDFNRLAGNFGNTSSTWSRGDFNYDGNTNLSDFNALAANFGRAV